MITRSQDRLDQLAVMAFGLLLAVCTAGVAGIIVFATLGIAPALIAAAAMTIVVAVFSLALNSALMSR